MDHRYRRDTQSADSIKDLLPETCAFVLLHKGSPEQFWDIGPGTERFFACARNHQTAYLLLLDRLFKLSKRVVQVLQDPKA